MMMPYILNNGTNLYVVMGENIIVVLENTFLSPFHNKLDAAKLYNI